MDNKKYIRDIYEGAGINVNKALENICADENVLQMILKEFLNDQNMTRLRNSLKIEDYKCAFSCAHALKGVFANLGMTNLQNICYEMVEKLRVNDYYVINDLLNSMNGEYEKVCKAILEVEKYM